MVIVSDMSLDQSHRSVRVTLVLVLGPDPIGFDRLYVSTLPYLPPVSGTHLNLGSSVLDCSSVPRSYLHREPVEPTEGDLPKGNTFRGTLVQCQILSIHTSHTHAHTHTNID